jgi:Tol biopolymer transport system component/acetyl esterase/lipase
MMSNSTRTRQRDPATHSMAVCRWAFLMCAALTAFPAAAQVAGNAPNSSDTQGSSKHATAPPARQERDSLVLEGIPPRDAALAGRLDRYRQSRGARFLDWLPDGSMLVGTRFAEVEQVHRVAGPLADREQLTFFTDPVTEARAPHTGTGVQFVLLKDQGGDENAQLYLYTSPAHIQQLTPGHFHHGSPVWSNDGQHVAFFGTERDGVSYDVYVADIGANAAPHLVAGGQQDTWLPLDWSPDDRKLLLRRVVSVNESYLQVADVYTGTITQVDDSGHKVGIGPARFAPDGRGIYYTSDEDGEFAQLRHVDPVTHEVRRITANVPWDIESFDVSSDGRYVAWVANNDGQSKLTISDTLQKTEQSPAGLPDGQISNVRFDRTGKRLAVTAESATSPRDVFVYDLNRNAFERWTHSETGPLESASLVPAELVRYPTWDRAGGVQRMISAYLYRPRTAGPHPVVINIHGGPEAQYRPTWDPFTQFLVNELGYAVVAPNVRGSSGYGKSFAKLDNGVLREDAVKDIGSLIVWIGLQSSFDRNRIAVMGSSYGGYMALASVAAYGDRLKGGIDDVGISNFVTYLQNTQPYRRELLRSEYGDERDAHMRSFLSRISPLSNVASIRRPLLVTAGMNDPAVPATESQNIVWRMRSKGADVWYLAARDEGHGFRRKVNEDVYLETAAMFLQRLAAP